MKKLCFITLLIFLQSWAQAKQVITVHYLGDARPIKVDLPLIVNKGGQSTLENSTLQFIFDPSTTLGLNANFNISVEGNNISIEGDSINRSLIEVITNKIDEKTYNAAVRFIPSEGIMDPIVNGISQPQYQNNQLTFYAGNLDNEKLFNLNLKIVRSKFLKKDEILFANNLTNTDYTVSKISENKTLVTIDLKKITNQEFNEVNKNQVTVDMKLNYNFEHIVNLKQIGQIEYIKNLEIIKRN